MYLRTTRETSLSALPATIASALGDHAAKNQIELDAAGVRCWLTHSENPPANGFLGKVFGRRANPVDPDAEHFTALVLHPMHVIVATAGAKRGTVVMSLPLAQASLTRGALLAAQIGIALDQEGVTLSGFPGTQGCPGTYFVGLAGASGAECADVVEAAIRAQKNPR